MSRPCHVLRVFTRGDEGGNHLGVVNDVVGLSDDDMQRIATELGFSETVFVDWVDGEDDPSVRIFTPASELPFAGHPLVGTAWVLTELGPHPTNRIMTRVGAVDYMVDDQMVHVSCDITISILEPDDVVQLCAAAGMPDPISTIRLAMPKEYAIAEYDSFDDVAALAPDMDALATRFGLLVFARDGDAVKERFFAPHSGIDEDPATGSAAVALARALSLRGEEKGSVTISQGDEIGHPSTIELAWEPGRTTIGGTVRRDEVVLVK